MKNKKGFTLIEIIGVVALLGILAIITTPMVVKTLNKNKLNALKIEENNIEDASDLFIEDYCNSPISSLHKSECKEYVKSSGRYHYVCISDLKKLDYFSSDIEYEGSKCNGLVLYDQVNTKYKNGTTYIKCEDKYDTYTGTVCDKEAVLYNKDKCDFLKNNISKLCE